MRIKKKKKHTPCAHVHDWIVRLCIRTGISSQRMSQVVRHWSLPWLSSLKNARPHETSKSRDVGWVYYNIILLIIAGQPEASIWVCKESAIWCSGSPSLWLLDILHRPYGSLQRESIAITFKALCTCHAVLLPSMNLVPHVQFPAARVRNDLGARTAHECFI